MRFAARIGALGAACWLAATTWALSGCLGGDLFEDDAGVDGGFGGEGGGGDDTGDVCADGCAALDDCGLCLPDAEDECLSVDDCAATCDADGLEVQASCLVGLDACDQAQVDACLELEGSDDVCARGCLALDACDLCVPDLAGDCLAVADCAEGCRVDGETTAALCFSQVADCDQDAFDACFEQADDACAQACRAIDACGLCDADDEGECLSVGECADACRAGADAEPFSECILAVEACEQDALDACFEATSDDDAGVGDAGLEDAGAADAGPEMEKRLRPATPWCTLACQRRAECADPSASADDLEACARACRGAGAAEARCVVEAATCADAADC